MTNHRIALAISTPSPVAASCVVRTRNGRSIVLGSGEHVVFVGSIDTPRDYHALLVQRGFLVDLVVVAMEVRHIRSDFDPLGVEPMAVTDAVLSVDAARTLR